MEQFIEYYEFPNGTIVKCVPSDHVYRYDPDRKTWDIDYALTAEFAWDKPYGAPCEHLRQKADIRDDLPPFPYAEAFFPGNTVFFGAYPQKSPYDFSPIPWIVLDITGSTALCISRDCLITSGYCNPPAPGKPELLWWEHSVARAVCNQHFLDTAFSDAEKAKLLPRTAATVQNGEKCTDPVFLLTQQEVLQYFPTDAQRKARPTSHARHHGARLGWTEDTKDCTSWWILPEEEAHGQVYPKAVFQMGEIQFHSRNVYHRDFTIRPCIQIQFK